ncbi:MAG: two-component regulator propeller domain-containing protein, partial [Saprospiraceae bacterium]
MKSYTENEGLAGNFILSICEDKNHILWLGTDNGGVSRFDGTFFTNYGEAEGLSNGRVLSILADKKNNIWFGTESGGVTRFDGITFTHFTDKEGLINNKVWSILEDNIGNIWFGTDIGVSKFDGKNIYNYSEKEGLPNSAIYSMTTDSIGNIWFGTQGSGIVKFDGKSFTNYTTQEGLNDNLVWSLMKDKKGNLWVGTEKGLNSFFDVKDLSASNSNADTLKDKERIKILSFKHSDGLKSISFLNCKLIDSRNTAWWGTSKEIVKLDLNKFSIPVDTPSIYLRQLDINGQFVDFRNMKESTKQGIEYDSVTLFENYPLNLKLTYDNNYVSFHYSGIDWTSPSQLRYSYQLEGLNNVWTTPTQDIKADYQNLSNGNYIFKVKAIGAAQIWSKPFEYSFTILPPWWRTRWAYGFYVLILAGLMVLADRQFRKRLLQKEKERNREKELAQAKEIEKAYSELKETQAQLIQSAKMASLGELTAGIAHEIQNPLNFVNNFSEINTELIGEMKENINAGKLDEVRLIAEDI